jgi:hypothetical protein
MVSNKEHLFLNWSLSTFNSGEEIICEEKAFMKCNLLLPVQEQWDFHIKYALWITMGVWYSLSLSSDRDEGFHPYMKQICN